MTLAEKALPLDDPRLNESRPSNGNGIKHEPPAAPPAKPKGKKKAFLLVVGILVLVGLSLLARYMVWAAGHESTDDAFIEAHVTAVSPQLSAHVLRVLVQDNQMVKAGDVLVELDPRAFQTRLAHAQAALDFAHAKLEAAQKDVELTKINTAAALEDAKSGLEMAKSAVQTAEAQVVAAKSRSDEMSAAVQSAQALVDQEKAAVASAEAEAQRAKADYERYSALVESNSVSRQQVDAAAASAKSSAAELDAAHKRVASAEAQVAQANSAQATAAANVKAAESQVIEAQSHIGEAQAKLDAASSADQQIAVKQAAAANAAADVKQAEADEQQAELDLSYTHVTAPVAGRVTRKGVEDGAYVSVGQALMAIVPSDVWVVANFKETQLKQMKPGQPVEIEIDSYPDVKLKGHVDSIQSGTGSRFSMLPPENATGNFVKVVQRVPVKIVLDEIPKDLLLAPGMSVTPVVEIK